MSIYDLGRPTGAMGGSRTAETDRRTDRDSDFAYKKKNAEFMDYLMDAELRGEARKAGIARAKQVQAIVPSETDAMISENVLDSKQAEANFGLVDKETELRGKANQLAINETEAKTRLLPEQTRMAFADMHTRMNDMQYDRAAQVYGAMSEALQAGVPKEQAYAQHRQMLLEGASDKTAAEAMLARHGITPEYSDDALNKFMGLANYGLHNAKLVREEHMLESEYKLRRSIELAKQSKPEFEWKAPDADERKAIGNTVARSVTYFDELDGDLTEKGTYETGSSKAALVDWISNWSYAQMRGKQNDPNVTPSDYQAMAIDMLNSVGEQATGKTWAGFGASTFNTRKFETMMNTAVNQVDNMLIGVRGAEGMGQDDKWEATGPAIMAMMNETHNELEEVFMSLPNKGAKADNFVEKRDDAGMPAIGTPEFAAKAREKSKENRSLKEARKKEIEALYKKAQRTGSQEDIRALAAKRREYGE